VNQGYVDALRACFAAHADAPRAAEMQAYMKSAMPFVGLPAPLRRQLAADVLRAHPLADADELLGTMQQLWRTAAFREERYTAIELGHKGRLARSAGLRLLPLYEEMIQRGAWWEYCDDISGNGLPPLLQRFPAAMKPLLRRWAVGTDFWLRRAAILCQRKMRADFDAVLFYDCILPSIGSSPFASEFFIRKGIGWALRERAYRAPDEVRAFCREYAAQLSPLTLREALRVIDKTLR
jgi:3-methyladenine DNA glycosylase AlkD